MKNMTLPLAGSVVRILNCRRLALVLETLENQIRVAVASNDSGRVTSFLVARGEFEIVQNSEVKAPRYHVGQDVVVQVNGQSWTGPVAAIDGPDYVVNLLVRVTEDELQPFVIRDPGH